MIWRCGTNLALNLELPDLIFRGFEGQKTVQKLARSRVGIQHVFLNSVKLQTREGDVSLDVLMREEAAAKRRDANLTATGASDCSHMKGRSKGLVIGVFTVYI